jgi:hypothetical protein
VVGAAATATPGISLLFTPFRPPTTANKIIINGPLIQLITRMFPTIKVSSSLKSHQKKDHLFNFIVLFI